MQKKILRIPIKDKTTGKKLVMMDFTKANLTKKQIAAEVYKVSQEFKKKNQNGQIMTQLFFGDNAPVKWGSSEWSDFGKKVKLFNIVDYSDGDFQEPTKFTAFKIFLRNQA